MDVESHGCYAFMVLLRLNSTNIYIYIYIVCPINLYDMHFTCVLLFPRYIYNSLYSFSLTNHKQTSSNYPLTVSHPALEAIPESHKSAVQHPLRAHPSQAPQYAYHSQQAVDRPAES